MSIACILSGMMMMMMMVMMVMMMMMVMMVIIPCVTNLGVILFNILNLLYPHDQSQIYPDLNIQQ